jgi:hypothetical protein
MWSLGIMIDQYRRGWALRYLREAKAELEAAREMPYMAQGLIIEAIRKARNAIYYSLGEPSLIEGIVREAAENMEGKLDPILKCLVEMEETLHQFSYVETMDREKTLKRASALIQLASEIVETVTGEKVD